eukprot:CAMPEP_0194330376 /NCGR_PEP_ID=MMETSP0171-20130528/51751_1 /TAXON_ID=218684 /ORGANISM="Corethron pennatum, Strain L29A3" /LENGTH=354 /DNA_ID=CAMNT_0039091449 /DNA_START=128 /DNA_END=1189 /DNA_ORIENTATION=+
MRRKPLGLDISIDLVNGPDGTAGPSSGASSSGNPGVVPISASSQESMEDAWESTYRSEGLSIGLDFMRYHGRQHTGQALSPSVLQIEGTIGRGACSVVKRARHSRTSELFALKSFKIYDESRRSMLAKEIGILLALECDCLVRLEGAFFESGVVTMVLEYMDCGSLQSIFRKYQQFSGNMGLPESAAAAIAYQILWGVAFLHHEGMVHRDIKPENVLVNSLGEVKLTDFGIASSKQQQGQMNSTVVGTARFMSLERLKAQPYGPESDIWSFGLTLIDCVCGLSPFEGMTSPIEFVQTLEESTTEDLISPLIKGEVRELISACLHRQPEKRVPANLLLASPWFEAHEVYNVDAAV